MLLLALKIPVIQAWVDVSEEIAANVQRARMKMVELAKAHAKALMPSFGDGKEDQRSIEGLTQEITGLLRKSEKQLKRLAAAGPYEDSNVRKNVQLNMRTYSIPYMVNWSCGNCAYIGKFFICISVPLLLLTSEPFNGNFAKETVNILEAPQGKQNGGVRTGMIYGNEPKLVVDPIIDDDNFGRTMVGGMVLSKSMAPGNKSLNVVFGSLLLYRQESYKICLVIERANIIFDHTRIINKLLVAQLVRAPV
ncbi:hypothetical protein NC652_030426 [Populus alba x Populus x berolinensis]|nr:hypothetical protein NC652_030426 [Populus alba x Populus x berolinensis]